MKLKAYFGLNDFLDSIEYINKLFFISSINIIIFLPNNILKLLRS